MVILTLSLLTVFISLSSNFSFLQEDTYRFSTSSDGTLIWGISDDCTRAILINNSDGTIVKTKLKEFKYEAGIAEIISLIPLGKNNLAVSHWYGVFVIDKNLKIINRISQQLPRIRIITNGKETQVVDSYKPEDWDIFELPAGNRLILESTTEEFICARYLNEPYIVMMSHDLVRKNAFYFEGYKILSVSQVGSSNKWTILLGRPDSDSKSLPIAMAQISQESLLNFKPVTLVPIKATFSSICGTIGWQGEKNEK